MIVFFYQLDEQILYFNTFITLLYMFRALLYSSSGGQIVLVQHLVLSLSLGDCSVHRLREDYRNTFITLLYMFRAILCSSSVRQIVLVQHLVLSLFLGDCSVQRLRQSSRNVCTEQSPKDSDNTRCCTKTIVLLKTSTIMLETCRGV